jgi:hypothetical protein
LGDLQRELRIAQHLGEHSRHYQHRPVLERPVETICVVAAVPLQESDPGARVDGDHRSAFSSVKVRAK